MQTYIKVKGSSQFGSAKLRTALATMTLFYAVLHWNSFFSALIYLREKEKYPIQLILRNIVIEGDVSQQQVDLQEDEMKKTIVVLMTLLLAVTSLWAAGKKEAVATAGEPETITVMLQERGTAAQNLDAPVYAEILTKRCPT